MKSFLLAIINFLNKCIDEDEKLRAYCTDDSDGPGPYGARLYEDGPPMGWVAQQSNRGHR